MGNGLATYYKTETRSNAYNTTDRLHTGKEFHAFDGLSWHDNAARFHDTLFPRFTTVDPLAEKDPGSSPYAYCGNNPLLFIDQSDMYLLVTGNVKEKAVNQLQSYVGEGVVLKMSSSGIVSFSASRSLTDKDLKLIEILNAPDILVSVYTTTSNYASEDENDFFVGGAFMGNELNADTNSQIKVITHQVVNPDVLGTADSITETPGTMIMHEITESYEGGKIALSTGKSITKASKDKENDKNNLYMEAHKMATPQTKIYYHFYDKDGKEVNEQAKAKIIICTVKDKNGIEQEIQSLY